MDRWTDRLSAYLDEEMGREERSELEVHLAECNECRDAVEGLRAVVRRARGLEARGPAADLWPGILARIEGGADVVPIGVTPEATGARRHFAFTFRQLIAAGLALLLTGAATSWFALGGGAGQAAPPTVAQQAADPAAGSQSAVFTAYQPSPEVQSRLSHLEALLDTARGDLDPETIAVIEKNLAIVEAAVQEAERALKQDPGNDYLRAHLERTLRTKVDVLERATALAET